jgi:two-component system response regulator FixJ
MLPPLSARMRPMTETLVAHVVDDDESVRRPLVMLAEAAGYAASGHDSAESFLRDADLGRAGCVVTDVRMPGMSGLDLLGEMARRAPGVPVIVITAYAEVPLAVAALKRGAADFIEKPFNGPIFQGAVRQAMARREAVIEGERALEALRERAARLTGRETEILRRIAAGASNAEAAEALSISVRTVENHRASVLAKLEARGLSDLVRAALQLGLI